MRFLPCSCSFLALLALLAAAPSTSRAAVCSDTSGFAAAMEAVEAAVPCDGAAKHAKYVKSAKKALGGALSGACKKAFVKRFIANSTCGRGGFEVCCQVNKKGKDVSKVVKIGKCKGTTCSEQAPTSVGEGCTSNGLCATTTTTSTTTTTLNAPATTTTTSSTTTTTCPGGVCVQLNLDFTNGAAGGQCGTATDASNAVVKTLTCGGLNIGGGATTIQEGPTPDGATNRFMVSCADVNSVCSLAPYTTPPPVNSAAPDCSTTGCNFGTPLEIPNPNLANLTVCVLNSFAAPASGTLSLVDGTSSTNVSLTSDNYITGNLAQPCPRCRADAGGTGTIVSGSQAAPATGFCDRGPRTGQACTSTNSIGLTRDCPTGGAGPGLPCGPSDKCIDGTHVGPISVDLTPLSTGTASKTDPAGNFCPGQGGTPGSPGCFAQPTCRTITETGKPAVGPITIGTPASATLASVFCIAATPNGLVNFAADLPGPGATSLPGTFMTSEP